MRRRAIFSAFVAAASLLACGHKVWAGPFPEFTDFATAWDTYVPDDHPLDHPNIFGSPPLGTYAGNYGTSSEGWFDGRNGGNGVMGRRANGTGQDALTNPYAPGGGGSYGVVFPDGWRIWLQFGRCRLRSPQQASK